MPTFRTMFDAAELMTLSVICGLPYILVMLALANTPYWAQDSTAFGYHQAATIEAQDQNAADLINTQSKNELDGYTKIPIESGSAIVAGGHIDINVLSRNSVEGDLVNFDQNIVTKQCGVDGDLASISASNLNNELNLECWNFESTICVFPNSTGAAPLGGTACNNTYGNAGIDAGSLQANEAQIDNVTGLLIAWRLWDSKAPWTA